MRCNNEVPRVRGGNPRRGALLPIVRTPVAVAPPPEAVTVFVPGQPWTSVEKYPVSLVGPANPMAMSPDSDRMVNPIPTFRGKSEPLNIPTSHPVRGFGLTQHFAVVTVPPLAHLPL